MGSPTPQSRASARPHLSRSLSFPDSFPPFSSLPGSFLFLNNGYNDCRLDIRCDPGILLGFSLKAEGISYPNHLKRDVPPVPKNTGGIQQLVGEEANIKLGNFFRKQATSQTVKHTPLIRSSHSTLRYFPKRSKRICPWKDLYVNIQIGIIHHNQIRDFPGNLVVKTPNFH